MHKNTESRLAILLVLALLSVSMTLGIAIYAWNKWELGSWNLKGSPPYPRSKTIDDAIYKVLLIRKVEISQVKEIEKTHHMSAYTNCTVWLEKVTLPPELGEPNPAYYFLRMNMTIPRLDSTSHVTINYTKDGKSLSQGPREAPDNGELIYHQEVIPLDASNIIIRVHIASSSGGRYTVELHLDK
jgi:hypothetical protein